MTPQKVDISSKLIHNRMHGVWILFYPVFFFFYFFLFLFLILLIVLLPVFLAGSKKVQSGAYAVAENTWYTMQLELQETLLTGYL
jgi:hypothetical protein